MDNLGFLKVYYGVRDPPVEVMLNFAEGILFLGGGNMTIDDFKLFRS